MANPYPQQIVRCGKYVHHRGTEALLLTVPSNMFCVMGDGKVVLKIRRNDT